jgi:hypothetical protein
LGFVSLRVATEALYPCTVDADQFESFAANEPARLAIAD